MTLCDQLKIKGTISENDCTLLRRFHYSIIHKLTSAVYSLEGIRSITDTGSYLSLTSTTGSKTPITTEFDDKFRINYFQDNFFSSLIGSFDILSLKLNLIKNNPIPNLRDCNFPRLVDLFFSSTPTGAIEGYLNSVKNSTWYKDTCPFRICLTHRQQFDFRVELDVVAGIPRVVKHYLPDDPLNVPYTYVQQREILPFCEDKLHNFVNVINDVNGLLISETNRIGHIPF